MASLLISPPAELLGALTPRVEHRPSVTAGGYGDIAHDLMVAAGKPLEPWQRDSLDLLLSSRPDGKWACYEYAEWVARQNGKGGIGEARALAGLLVLGEELIIWSAHEYKTAMEAFRRMRTLLRALGTPVSDTLVDIDGVYVKISNTNGEEGFERPDTEQRIKFVARSKSSGRGFSGDLNIIDEAFAYTDDQQSALLPTLIARPNAQIVYLSSPPLTGDAGDIMFALKRRAEAGGASGDDGLGYRDWGVAGDLEHLDRIDLDDRGLWAQANPALGLGRVTEETIGRLRASMSPAGFAREVLGVWPRQHVGGGAIDLKQWAALVDPESRREGDIAIAVDIAVKRDYAAVAMYGIRPDGVGHVQLVDYRPGTDWIVPRVAELTAALDPIAIGMGRATAASLGVELDKAGIAPPEDRDAPERGDLAVTAVPDMTAAAGQMLDAVAQGTLRHLGQPELDASIAGARVKQTGDTLVWDRAKADADTSPVVAISVARWAFESRSHLIAIGTYDVLESIW